MLPHMRKSPTRVLFLCSGLGRIQGGYETFTRECYDALKSDPSLEIVLLKGGGKSQENEFSIFAIPRSGRIANVLGRLTRTHAYAIEQASFSLSCIAYILRYRPQVVYFSDRTVGRVLYRIRNALNMKFEILLSNGGGFPPPYGYTDYIHHVTPTHLIRSINMGIATEKQAFIPYGFHINREFTAISKKAKKGYKEKLDIDTNRPVLLSVGALQREQKRTDFLIQEISTMPEPRPYLIMLGRETSDTAVLREMATQKLGANNFRMLSVAANEVEQYYCAADCFVMTSLSESFGRVYVEALSHGLPCIVHEYDTTRYVMGNHATLADLSKEGVLPSLIAQELDCDNGELLQQQRHSYAFDNFSWRQLLPEYVEMLHRCAQGQTLATITRHK
ncbi:MAG: glycosyltransferase family 4 protein [Roseiflexaceae bacterium]